MEEQPAAAVSLFPTPPPFYKHFTKENLSRLKQSRKEAEIRQTQPDPTSTSDVTKPDLDILSLPAELRYLIAPSLPQDDRYKSFGGVFDLQAPPQSLTSHGIEQLYPAHASVKLNPQPHLLSLTRSLLTTFLSLVGILSKNPEMFGSKVDDLQTMMYNIHDLINEYRPHQARESLIMMMEERVEKLRRETRSIEENKERVERVVKELAEQGGRMGHEERQHAAVKDHDAIAPGKRKLERQRAAWAMLNTEMADDR